MDCLSDVISGGDLLVPTGPWWPKLINFIFKKAIECSSVFLERLPLFHMTVWYLSETPLLGKLPASLKSTCVNFETFEIFGFQFVHASRFRPWPSSLEFLWNPGVQFEAHGLAFFFMLSTNAQSSLFIGRSSAIFPLSLSMNRTKLFSGK